MSKPYIIQSVILVTYDGKKMPLEIINHNIISKPIKVVKEQILDAFSSMVNKPIKVLLKVRYI